MSGIPHPTKKKVRPSSAASKLQTHPKYNTGILDSPGRPKTAAGGGFRSQSGQRLHISSVPTASDDESHVQEQRRLTLGHVDGIGDTVDTAHRHHVPNKSVSSLLKSRIEESINIDTLAHLKVAFQQADVDGSGELDLEEFKELLKEQLGISSTDEGQIEALFYKIDWSSDGAITWDEFCTYMQLEYSEKEDTYKRDREVSFHTPAKVLEKENPHREAMLRISSTSDGLFIACSQDGTASFWSGSMEKKKTKTVIVQEQQSRQKTKWITDYCIMQQQYNKFIVGTGDREIQFFELSSFEPYCMISALETVPLRMDYSPLGDDECMILYGDSQGCINILIIYTVGECLRTWKKCTKEQGIANISIEEIVKSHNVKFIRWRVHNDWVQEMKYFPNIRQIISCSNDANTALVIGCTTGSTHVEQQLREATNPTLMGPAAGNITQKRSYAYSNTRTRLATDENVFKVYKGVKTFDFCRQKNILVTGGVDKIIRIWNPYVPSKPTGLLKGHTKPIFYLFIAEEENRIFSISTDRVVKIWDIYDQNCLLTVLSKQHKIRGELQACHYNSVSKSLMVATDKLAMLTLKLKPIQADGVPVTHRESIHAFKYNEHFKQVISCSDAGSVKVWDLETGAAIFDFNEAHEDQAITCMTLDHSGRRLITGGRDGTMRIWNYNNGHKLKVLTKPEGNQEICDCVYVDMNRNKYIVAVGWDRHINIYADTQEETVHLYQHPLPKWTDDLREGHVEDILAVAISHPNMLATSSYDGEVIVWNMVSGHIFCHLRAPERPTASDEDRSINCLQFLQTRSSLKDSASLVTSGPYGHIHFWRVFDGGHCFAQFKGSCVENSLITCICLNKDETLLFTGDNAGFIYQWNIDGYAMESEWITSGRPPVAKTKSPELINTWRGHIDNVTCIEYLDDYRVLMSSSLDCTLRVWTQDGDYVGTFGQPDQWNVFNPSTYQHPMVPYDVLVDPLSLPDHPILAHKQSTAEVVHEDSAQNSDDDSDWQSAKVQLQLGLQQYQLVSDETIADQLRQRTFENATGKRLRHEKRRPKRTDRGASSGEYYQMLKCYDLQQGPKVEDPRNNREKGDDFLDEFI